MLSAHLMGMIEDHAQPLTSRVLSKLATDPRTLAYQSVPRHQLQARLPGSFTKSLNWSAGWDVSLTKPAGMPSRGTRKRKLARPHQL
jgi:hypothetical protein